MADYYPLIARAVAGVEKNTAESRRALYGRARDALVAQLRGTNPPLSEADITRERLALEEAIRKVESEAVRTARLEATRAAQASAPPRVERPAAPPQRPAEPVAEANPPAADNGPGRPPEGAPQPPRPRREPAPPPPPAQSRAPEPRASNAEPRAPQQRIPDFHAEPRAPQPRPRAAAPGAEPVAKPAADEAVDLDSMPPGQRVPPGADVDEVSLRPRRSFRGLAIVAVLLLAFVGAAGAVWWQLPNIVALMGPTRTPVLPPTKDAGTRPKIDDRLLPGGQGSQQTGPAVAQRVVLYEEDPNDPQGKRVVGSAIWKTETISPGAGQPPDVVVKADIEVPERKMAMTFSFRRNTDQALPASHTAEVIFKLPPDFPSGGVGNVPGILMKQSEQARGVPLAGVAVKVTNNYFLIALYSVDAEKERNIKLIKERSWFDIPIVYTNNRRAILAMEKGTPGERAFDDAFKAWGQ